MQRVVRRMKRFLSQPVSAKQSLSQPIATGLAALATAEDVANCYRLILGRKHEADAVIEEKLGLDRATLIRAFFSSEEFRSDISAFIEGRLHANLFSGPVTGDLRRWTATLLLPHDHDEEALAEIQDLAPLLAFCLGYPILANLLDESLGEGQAAVLAPAAAKIAKPRLKVSTCREDLQNCYLLFLQRAPESEDVIKARADTPLAESICDFLASPEFAAKVAYAAMDGRFVKAQIPPAVPAWAAEKLLIENASSLDLSDMIAAALTQPAIAHALSGRKLSWSVPEVVRRLQLATGESDAKNLASLHDRLEQIGLNLEVLTSNDMKLGSGGHMIEFTGNDPWVSLTPVGPAIENDLLALRFRASIDGHATTGQLYLDYGEGFVEGNSIPLGPDLNGFQRATIAAPRRLVAIRWDPAATTGTASISLIEAMPLTTETYFTEEFGGIDQAGGASLLLRFAMEASRRPETPAAMALTRMLSPITDARYNHWLSRNEPQGAQGREDLKKRYEALADRPLISIIVPTYNPSATALSEMIASVREQVYENWELCIANDASTYPHVRRIIDEAAIEDRRIKVVHRSTNGHICRTSNSALELATGSWIAMLDHDDTLAPQALLAVAEYLAAHPSSGLIYSDEDKLDERGQRFDPYFKPDYSPELLLAQNYVNHLTVMRADLVREVGGWRTGFEGSQDHDLILRVIEKLQPEQVGHIPQILYHWRALTGSTALDNEEKDYVLRTGEAAVREHLIRTNQAGRVEVLKGVHHYRVRYALPEETPLVSLIIPTRDKADILKIAVDSILKKSTYDNYEIIIVDNGSSEKSTFEYFSSLASYENVKIVPYPYPFNYSKINNFAVERARGSIIALVNNDIEVITPDWIEEMTSWALKKDIGCVGAKLFYPDMSIQHAGVIVGLGGCAGHSHKYFPHDAAGYFNRLQVHQNLSAVTAACLFVRREVFEEVGGLEEKLTVAFNDVDFCLRVREAGYRNLFTPFAKLFHHESISRGAEDTPEKMARAAAEVKFMKDRWKEQLTIDPYYSPHLPYDREDFGINMAGLRY